MSVSLFIVFLSLYTYEKFGVLRVKKIITLSIHCTPGTLFTLGVD
jgi:hypothetical protein